jgi:hypothetical protein
MQEKNITPRLRLQPSEHRFILILGDITAAVLALFTRCICGPPATPG